MNIVQSFVNLRLRLKLLIAFGSLLLLTVLLVAVFFYTLRQRSAYENASEEVDALSIDVLEMDAAMRDFIYEGYKSDSFHLKNSSPPLNKYRQHRKSVEEHLKSFQANTILQGLLPARMDSTLQKINDQGEQLTRLFKERGFRDYGMEGSLRKAIHEVEKSSFPYDKVDMLTLRRHEKDFFLRKDLKYQKEFNAKIEAFLQKIDAAPVSEHKAAIVDNVLNYQNLFNSVVDIEGKIGIKEKEGIKGAVNKELEVLKQSIFDLRTAIKEAGSEFESKATWGLIILFAAQLALGLVLAITYSNIITHAITELQRAMQRLADGFFPDLIAIKSTEEIGKTKMAFNQLLERMKTATEFAGALGNGHFNTHYNSQYAKDILAQSLIRMQEQLNRANETQSLINWNNAGVVQLNEILKNESADVKIIADQLLSTLTRYLKANQSVLYLLEEENHVSYLQSIATYAYGKKRFVEQRIPEGQGLAGQCVLERDTIVLTDLPQDYVKITSGLGEALPRFLILVPLMVQGNVMGVLEMASFDIFKKHEIEFLKRVSENIASLLASKKTSTDTLRLLSEAREQAQRLASQEEEIQQNAEKMKAIQEQMLREKKELEQQVAQLKKKLAVHQNEESVVETA